jgi:cytochrome bd-type quinol oxidase subunit 2
MRVTNPSCTLPSGSSLGCSCAQAKPTNGKAAGAAAAVTALAAAACTACCVLPLTLPAAVIATAGGTIAVLDHAHGWMTKLSIAVVVSAWLWIVRQRLRTERRIARTAIVLMALATLLTTTAASWPWIEPAVFATLGIVKNKAGAPRT